MVRKCAVSFAAISLLWSFSAAAGILDFFNGVEVGQVVPSAGLKYIHNPPKAEAKATLVYFWGTWCAPCRDAIPSLNALQAARSAQMAVVAITDEKEPEVRAFLKAVAVTYSIAVDEERKVFDPLKIRAVPYAALIDKERKVLWRGQFKDLNAGELDKLLSAAP